MLVELDLEEQKQYEKLVDFPGSSFTSHITDVIANKISFVDININISAHVREFDHV